MTVGANLSLQPSSMAGCGLNSVLGLLLHVYISVTIIACSSDYFNKYRRLL